MLIKQRALATQIAVMLPCNQASLEGSDLHRVRQKHIQVSQPVGPSGFADRRGTGWRRPLQRPAESAHNRLRSGSQSLTLRCLFCVIFYSAQHENHRFIRCIFWLELSIMSPELHAITVLKNTISNMMKTNKSNAFVVYHIIFISSIISLARRKNQYQCI